MWDPVPAFAHRCDVDVVVRIWRVDARGGEDHVRRLKVNRAREARAVSIVTIG